MRAISDAVIRGCYREIQSINGAGHRFSLPVDVHAIAKFLGVKILEPSELMIDGYVGTNARGEMVIRYRRANSPQRNRFTIAHEIAHLLIAKVSGKPITSRKMRTGMDYEECVANRLGAEILMPRNVLRQDLARCNPSWKNVQALRRSYDVSSFALLRRTTEIDGVASVFGRFGFSPDVQRSWFSCDSSSSPMISFKQRFEKLVYEQLYELARTNFIAFGTIEEQMVSLPCGIRPSSDYAREEGWVFGWTVL